MAPMKHPITGIDVNPILVERVQLDFDAAVTAWVLKLQGAKFNIIAQTLGTNPMRIGEVFRGDKFPEARAEAARRLSH
ncbi:hypothetical protein [Paracoccus alkenifer]|uniref:hypothetical protein n=1 Tax=Paracoccus alkenifer TaxID=65735 RepID=UPI001FE0BB2D|nr:hypothetical protein [Paracoccus alkenifer]